MDYSQIYLNLHTTDGILHKETSYFLNSFLAYKNAINRNRKLGIFQEGLTHGFGQNFNIFSQFLFL